MWFALLLLLPTVLGAPAGSELNTFLHVHPGTPMSVSCDGNYIAYVYSNGDSVYAIILARDGVPVFSEPTYSKIAAAILYKLQIQHAYQNARILRPDLAASLQSLAATLRDEKYSYDLAKKGLNTCVPALAPRVDNLDNLRAQTVRDLLRFSQALSTQVSSLTDYLNRDSFVSCSFALDTGIYSESKSVWSDLASLDSYSRQLIAAIQLADTNCSVDSLRGIIDSLKPPYDLGQLEFLNTAADGEAQLFSRHEDPARLSSLRTASARLFWKTLYQYELTQPVETQAGMLPLPSAITILTNPAVKWKDTADISAAQRELSTADSLAQQGKYDEAYSHVLQARDHIREAFLEGTVQDTGSHMYIYVAAGALLLALMYVFVRKRGKNNEEDDVDYYSDSYG